VSASIEAGFSEHMAVVEQTRIILRDGISRAVESIARSLADGGTMYLCGNGGSAADSQHIAAEMVGRFKKDRRPLRAIALTTDTSILTCVANDYSYDDIFSRQMEAFGRAGDVLVAISTSGNSENVRRALLKSKEAGVFTIALLGKGGGPCQELADISLVVPSSTTARIQEMHILIGHLLCELVEQEMGFA
jgi:D-sedoheptulose 7-phosphate isomerase